MLLEREKQGGREKRGRWERQRQAQMKRESKRDCYMALVSCTLPPARIELVADK